MHSEKMQWFRNARFGMFIHWGLYSQLGRGEWAYHNENIPAENYAKLASEWYPSHACFDQWADLAGNAGMGYMVLTTKHHDGFCLFNTKYTDFNAVARTPQKRDFVAEYIDACRSRGLKVGLYYSVGDWTNEIHQAVLNGDESRVPELKDFLHGHVRELLTNYGKIDMLWYDGAFYDGKLFTPETMDPEGLNAMARSLQPEILINPRAGVPGDFETAENTFEPSRPGVDWEFCTCINDLWGYGKHDYNYKTINQLIFLLVNCASHGGNFLLNIGPKADGSVPQKQVELLSQMGAWMQQNAAAIRGSERVSKPMSASGRVTKVGHTLYYHVIYWPGREMVISDLDDETLGGKVGSAPIQARLLATGQELETQWRNHHLIITGLPDNPPDTADTVIAVNIGSNR